MGQFVDGEWKTGWYPSDKEGRFQRTPTTFHNRIAEPESGRYHLYVSWACPWAHRTLITRSLQGLEEAVSVSVVDWYLTDDGWAFNPERPGATEDHVNDRRFLREVYKLADDRYTGRVTVPVLWDKQEKTIVNNESRQIMRMLNQVFGGPRDLIGDEAATTAVIDAIYEPINNGVYKCGFARSQKAYDEAVTSLFAALDQWEAVLERQPFLCGSELTEADICMFTTLVRFDPVYAIHFKCSRRRIADYPNLFAYLKRVYNLPGVAETCNFDHIRNHYYQSHTSINPHGIVAQVPDPHEVLAG